MIGYSCIIGLVSRSPLELRQQWIIRKFSRVSISFIQSIIQVMTRHSRWQLTVWEAICWLCHTYIWRVIASSASHCCYGTMSNARAQHIDTVTLVTALFSTRRKTRSVMTAGRHLLGWNSILICNSTNIISQYKEGRKQQIFSLW